MPTLVVAPLESPRGCARRGPARPPPPVRLSHLPHPPPRSFGARRVGLGGRAPRGGGGRPALLCRRPPPAAAVAQAGGTPQPHPAAARTPAAAARPTPLWRASPSRSTPRWRRVSGGGGVPATRRVPGANGAPLVEGGGRRGGGRAPRAARPAAAGPAWAPLSPPGLVATPRWRAAPLPPCCARVGACAAISAAPVPAARAGLVGVEARDSVAVHTPRPVAPPPLSAPPAVARVPPPPPLWFEGACPAAAPSWLVRGAPCTPAGPAACGRLLPAPPTSHAGGTRNHRAHAASTPPPHPLLSCV